MILFEFVLKGGVLLEYIISLKGMLISEQKKAIKEKVDNIIYESEIIPVMGVMTNNPSKVKNLKFVENIRPSRKGTFQEGDFLTSLKVLPAINRDVLITNQLVGWGVNIAILDSGVDQSKISVNKCIDFTGTGTMDVAGHGTIVTKVVKYFAKGARLLFAKVGPNKPDEISVMRAIEWAIEEGADIINLSLSFKRQEACEEKCELCQLVNSIIDLDKVVVVAAGNENNKLDSIHCPGIATNAITVGASNENKNIADYSSFGKPGGKKPNIIAPGDITTSEVHCNGTSFAAPIVSGVLGSSLTRMSDIHKAIEYI